MNEHETVVTLSSKGQLVIPRAIRRALQLKPGAKLTVELRQDQIVLRPAVNAQRCKAAINQLYGKFANSGLLEELENERRQERLRDQARGF